MTNITQNGSENFRYFVFKIVAEAIFCNTKF